MELRDAYRMLEVASGAGEEAVRDARKTLSKVWHPDRYTNDPALQTKAEAKLREINEAFEVVRSAGFPATLPVAKPAKPEPTPVPPPAPTPTPAPAPSVEPTLELVPRRRVRWPVLLGLFAAIGIGAYFAIVKLGTRAAPVIAVRDPEPKPDPKPEPVPVAVDAAPIPDKPLDPLPNPSLIPAGDTFTFGSTLDEVLASQGEPNGRSASSSDEQITVNGRTTISRVSRVKLTYSRSEIDLSNDKVIGWWDNDVRLRVRIVPHDLGVVTAAKARGTLAKGSSKDEVLGVLGMPTWVTPKRWGYGRSELEFDDTGVIVGWTPGDVDLHVK